MTKKSYDVSTPHVGVMPTKTSDSSIKTCLCTMLVVLVICGLLLLLAFSYRRFGSQDKTQEAQDMINMNALRGRRTQTSSVSSNAIPSTTQKPEHKWFKSTTHINTAITKDSYSNDYEKTKQFQSNVPTETTEGKSKVVVITSGSNFSNDTVTEKSQIAIPNGYEGISTTKGIPEEHETSTNIGIDTLFDKVTEIMMSENRTMDDDTSNNEGTTEAVEKNTNGAKFDKVTEIVILQKNNTSIEDVSATTTTIDEMTSKSEKKEKINRFVTIKTEVSEESNTTMHDGPSTTEATTESQGETTNSGIRPEFTRVIWTSAKSNTSGQQEGFTTEMDPKANRPDNEEKRNRNEEEISTGAMDSRNSTENPTIITPTFNQNIPTINNDSSTAKTTPEEQETSKSIDMETEPNKVATTVVSEESHTTVHGGSSTYEGTTKSQDEIVDSSIRPDFTSVTEIRKTQRSNTTVQDESSTTAMVDQTASQKHYNRRNNINNMESVPQSSTKSICNSTTCSSIADHMVGCMKVSYPPCENFYEFACGGAWRVEVENEDIFDQLAFKKEDCPDFVKKFHIFYESCLNHEDRFHYGERIAEAKVLLNTIGSFEFEGKSDTKNNLTDYIFNLILFKAMPFFDVDVDIDPKNGTYILKLLKPDQSSLKLDHWSSFTDAKQKCIRIIEEVEEALPKNISIIHETFIKCQLNFSDYFDSIETSMKELGFFVGLSEARQSSHILEIRYFIEDNIINIFYKIMDSLSVIKEEMITRKYTRMTLVELEKIIPSIMWTRLFSLITNIDINNATDILIQDVNYFSEVFNTFTEENERDWKNAFLAILANSLYHNAVLPTHRQSRVKYCREISRELMPDISNYILEKKMSDGEILKYNNYVDELFIPLKNHFKESLEGLDWLDEHSKISMKKKVDKIELVFLDAINVVEEEQILEQHYANLKLKHGNYQLNLFNLMKYNKIRLLSLHGQSVTPANMYRNFVDFTKKEPVFFYTSNIVCIPYGITKKDTKEVPNYINLAQVGFSFAKIIGYSFDSIGMGYDVELQESSQQTYDVFVNETRDTIAFSDPIFFGDRQYSFTLTNSLSLSERIAENTALKLLEDFFKTLNKDIVLPWISGRFTHEKTFLLALTQEFCRKMTLMEFTIQAIESPKLPPQFRLENIMSNSKQFLEEFSCKSGSGMRRMESSSRFPDL